MDDATQTLVIINSVVLIIFLIVSLVALYYAIKIMRRIDRITEKTEIAVANLEEAAQQMKAAATPLGIGRALGSMLSNRTRRGSETTRK